MTAILGLLAIGAGMMLGTATPRSARVTASRSRIGVARACANAFRQASLAVRVDALEAVASSALPISLERAGRSVRVWRDHFWNAIAGGYRIAAGPIDALGDQLTASAATPEQRIGAALALRVADEGAGASRVRVAAEHCADPELRAALEAAAADEIDDAKLERALSRLAK